VGSCVYARIAVLAVTLFVMTKGRSDVVSVAGLKLNMVEGAALPGALAVGVAVRFLFFSPASGGP